MKIVLFCNHQIGLFAFQKLIQQKCLAGVVTSDFGHEFTQEAKLLALTHHLPFFECGKAHLSTTLLTWLQELSPDALLVMTFPFRLPKTVLDLAPKGCWNIHLGALPKYRGPDPVFWQIKNGENFGGISIHRMTERFDEGPIIYQEQVPISNIDILGTHLSCVAQAAPDGIQELLDHLNTGTGSLQKQDEASSQYHTRPTETDLTINWDTMSSKEIEQLVRATNPSYQGAKTCLRQVAICLHEVEAIPLNEPPNEKPGTIVVAPDDPSLYILCKDSACLRVIVASTTDAVCSGARLRALFNLRSGERFGREKKSTL